MNKTEYLLTCLSEECAELQQAVSKALRFGLNNRHPDGITTNEQDIVKECIDVIALMELIKEENIIPNFRDNCLNEEHHREKKNKVRYYMKYSKEHGTLEGVTT